MKLLLKFTSIILALMLLLSQGFAQASSDDEESDLKYMNEWYQAYTSKDESERYLEMARLAYQDLAQGEKEGKFGTKHYLAAIHFLLGEDKTVDDYHGKTEIKNKLYRYLGSSEWGSNFQRDCMKQGILNDDGSSKGIWDTKDVADKLGISEILVYIMLTAINDYIDPKLAYTFYDEDTYLNDW